MLRMNLNFVAWMPIHFPPAVRDCKNRTRFAKEMLGKDLRPVLQPLREDLRQARFEDRDLRLRDVVGDAEELHGQFLRVEDDERRRWIAVARLADGAGIDEVTVIAVEADDDVAADGHAVNAFIAIDREDHRQMRVTVEDEGGRGLGENLARVAFVENVLVLIVRRAMTEKDVLALDGAEREPGKKMAVARGEVIARPERGGFRGGVEAFGVVESGRDAVVIAADVELRRLHRAHRVEDLVRLRAVADKIAEADDLIELLAAHAVHHHAQGLRVRMKVADDERSHVRAPLDCERRAGSRKPFGSSSSSLSTISFVVSSSRTSMVMSDIR